MTEQLNEMMPCQEETKTTLALPQAARSIRRACQRGMVTAEYAVGILAAVAFALVLLKIFTNQDFFTQMLKFVLQLLGKVAGMLP